MSPEVPPPHAPVMVKKVLHLIDTAGPGGGEGIFLRLVEGLDPASWRSYAMVKQGGWVAARLGDRGIQPLYMPSGSFFKTKLLTKLAGSIRTLGIDLVQTHFLGPGQYGSVAGALSGTPVVATLHGEHDFDGLRGSGSLQFRLLSMGATRVVLVSRAVRTAFHARTSFPKDRSLVIHNGIDLCRFRPGTEPALRRALGYQESDLLVGAIGNIRPPKAYDVLLRAAAIVSEHDDRFRFVIAGDRQHPMYSDLVALRDNLGLRERLQFLGYRDDIDRILRCLDVFVSCSRSEGFSLTTVQAMASRIPVVATRSGGPEEIVRDGVDGLLVDRDAPQEIADALLRIVRNPALAKQLRTEGPMRARNAFSLERMIQDYESLYAELTQ